MVRSASQTAVDEPDESEEVDESRESAPFTFGEREVALYKPTDGQEYILLTLLNLGDESASKMEQITTIRTFGVMLSSLFLHQRDLDFVLGTLARGGEFEPFIDLARQMAEYWNLEEEAEADNRAERRAAERRPVKKAAPARRPAAKKAAPARPGR
jgi:hypothetical protein